MDENRFILKSGFGKKFDSGQKRGLKQPDYLKNIEEGKIIDLPDLDESVIKNRDIFSCLINRKTNRLFDENIAMNLDELSFILNMTQGVKSIRRDNNTLKRYVPSASGRHALESYIVVSNVKGLSRGLYRYLPLENRLLEIYLDENIGSKINDALNGQIFSSRASIVIIWTSVPERMEWRFGQLGEKLILIDSGHVCQNLYLAAEALELGACSVADYSQDKLDKLLCIDGQNEISIYIGLCGKKKLL